MNKLVFVGALIALVTLAGCSSSNSAPPATSADVVAFKGDLSKMPPEAKAAAAAASHTVNTPPNGK